MLGVAACTPQEDDRVKDLPTITVYWSRPAPYAGADASPIPERPGVYEILVEDERIMDRVFMGETSDLRRAFIAHLGGRTSSVNLRHRMSSGEPYFRYWLSDNTAERCEVAAALHDKHDYECGTDYHDGEIALVRVLEEE